MLTKEKLDEMAPHTIFAKGMVTDNPSGANMANTGNLMKWVAVRGGIHDWAIYLDNPYMPQDTFESVADMGDKLHNRTYVERLVPCDAEALALYRD